MGVGVGGGHVAGSTCVHRVGSWPSDSFRGQTTQIYIRTPYPRAHPIPHTIHPMAVPISITIHEMNATGWSVGCLCQALSRLDSSAGVDL